MDACATLLNLHCVPCSRWCICWCFHRIMNVVNSGDCLDLCYLCNAYCFIFVPMTTHMNMGGVLVIYCRALMEFSVLVSAMRYVLLNLALYRHRSLWGLALQHLWLRFTELVRHCLRTPCLLIGWVSVDLKGHSLHDRLPRYLCRLIVDLVLRYTWAELAMVCSEGIRGVVLASWTSKWS